jgi:3-oxoacyl-[acyl-carrier protein] reductase/meso-butanediol dehydrogenase/(S,S)-butanediol dehydrogenase/diacetyl reductase
MLKTVIITGGTKGIGADIARGFLNDSWHVIIAARNESGFAEENHENLKFQQMDVRVESDHQALVKIAFDWSGSLDCYINCAGFSQWMPVKNVDENFWDQMIDINLKGTFWGCKVAAEHLSSEGSIVNISSLAGKRGSANNALYCATKFGVNGITQALAKELGPKSIRVNAVCPVYVETPGLMQALVNPNAPPKGQDTAKYLKEFGESNAALERLPRGSEIADLCLYLASSKASAITGQCINVDCGVLPQ